VIKYFLTHICGFDPIILQKDDIADLTFRRFAYSFLFVILLTLFATYIVFVNSIDSIILSIIISLFFTLVIINLYRLIIVTSSPNNLLIQKENFKDLIGHYIVKLVLLMIIFFIISKPLETQLFKNKVDYYLDDYKINLVNLFEKKLSNSSNQDIDNLIYEYGKEYEFNIRNNLTNDSLAKLDLEKKINIIIENDERQVNELREKITSSNFFFQQIKIVNSEIPESFFISLLIFVLVFYPVYLIMYDNNFRKYFEEELLSNNHIIKTNWRKYSKQQENMFYETTGKKLIRQNLYQDPPFNRLKSIDKTKYLKKGSLVEWFKNNY
tara:strand:- start:3634 stop:4605 length:972 start_codon:yes stop_codon:yes gene_type:complete